MAVVMAGRLEDGEGAGAGAEALCQGVGGLRAIGEALRPPTLDVEDVEMGFGNVDSDDARVYGHIACPCDAGSAANSPEQLFRLNASKQAGPSRLTVLATRDPTVSACANPDRLATHRDPALSQSPA
jgi:hypothetical protein